MCEQCLTECDMYPDVLKDWALIRATKPGRLMKKDDWGLVRCNDPDFIWKHKPIKEPEETASLKEFDDWHDQIIEFSEALRTTPNVGHELIVAAINAGYDKEKHGLIEFWLFEHLAKWIETHEALPFQRSGIYD